MDIFFTNQPFFISFIRNVTRKVLSFNFKFLILVKIARKADSAKSPRVSFALS